MQIEHEKGSPQNPWRVYADGVFDLFHIGHARALKQAKEVEENVFLIVGVSGDEETHRIKGRTVLNEEQRTESVRHCRYADEVICPCPWVITLDFLEAHNIDFVVHGEDISYDENGIDVYKDIKEMGKYRTIKRTPGISTSDIIRNIVRDYDDFLRRNIKRGQTRQELNISFIKEKQIKVGSKIKEYKDKGMNFMKSWKNKKDELVTKFLDRFDKSRTIVTSFGKYFSSSEESDSGEAGEDNEIGNTKDNENGNTEKMN